MDVRFGVVVLSRRESPAARAGVALLSEALRHQPDGVPSPPRLRVWGARLPFPWACGERDPDRDFV